MSHNHFIGLDDLRYTVHQVTVQSLDKLTNWYPWPNYGVSQGYKFVPGIPVGGSVMQVCRWNSPVWRWWVVILSQVSINQSNRRLWRNIGRGSTHTLSAFTSPLFEIQRSRKYAVKKAHHYACFAFFNNAIPVCVLLHSMSAFRNRKVWRVTRQPQRGTYCILAGQLS